MKKGEIKCPYCPRKFQRGKHERAELIHHLWGAHKMDAPKAHVTVDQFLTTGKVEPLAAA